MYEDQNNGDFIQQNNQYLSFQNIKQILKDNSTKLQTLHLQQRIQKLVVLRDKLIQMIDMDKMAQTQRAVEERMGPKMCDNSVQPRNKIKNKFMTVLDDYKSKIILSNEKQRQMIIQVKQKCREHIGKLQSEFDRIKNDCRTKILQQTQKMKQIKLQSQRKDASLRADQDFIKIEQQLYNFQNEIDLQMLDFEILRRKRMDIINSKLAQFMK